MGTVSLTGQARRFGLLIYAHFWNSFAPDDQSKWPRYERVPSAYQISAQTSARRCNSPYFHYDHVHGELQFAGGELPNQVLHSGAANAQSQSQLQSSTYSQCDAKHGVPDGLYLDPTGVLERMRVELALSLTPRNL